METSDLLRGVGAVLAVVLSPFLIGAIIQISREWGIRGKAIQETVHAVVKVSATMETHTSEVREFWGKVTERLSKIDYILCGPSGENGLRSDVKTIAKRVHGIENRNREIDAIAASEREQYKGPEKRHVPRRERDSLIPEIPPVDRDTYPIDRD